VLFFFLLPHKPTPIAVEACSRPLAGTLNQRILPNFSAT